MRRTVLAFWAAGCVAAAAQAAGPSFEVASIKASTPPGGGMHVMMRVGCQGGPGSDDPGRLSCENMSLAGFIAGAYGIKSYQLAAPGWMNDARFDIAAPVPAGTTKEQFQRMEQNLLAQRFGLVLHREKKNLPAYELSVGKNGPTFKAADPAAPLPAAMAPAGRGGSAGRIMMMMDQAGVKLQAPQETMDGLVNFLGQQLGQPVVDATGLKGEYDITLTFSPEGLRGPGGGMMMAPPAAAGGDGGAPAAGSPAAPPTLLVALQEQLGLKLESKRALLDTLVVDHAEKIPSGN